ncbi:MAG: caspase family protein [Magnetococcales bacterium]|nr:caspase family protein [Magnetococcales bacterium]
MGAKALLVGINKYAYINPLGGCVNDVKDMANTLISLGVIHPTPGELRILTDGNATRANILAGLKWLVTGAKKGDLRIFHYSGHGSQVVDVNGDEMVDHKDETICPQDMQVEKDMITDDHLAALFKGINSSEVTLEVILDSCHSGTGTRDLNAGDNQTLIRSIRPSLDHSFLIDANPELKNRRVFRNSVIDNKMNHVLWAGCRDSQTSGEGPINGVQRGFFTYAFCKCLRGAGKGIIRAKLDSQISLYMKNSLHASQTPQLECDATNMKQPIFT